MSNISIWPIEGSLSDDTTLDQSGPGSDGDKGVLRFPIWLFSVISRTLVREVLPLYRDNVGVFYSLSQVGHIKPEETCCNLDSREKPAVKTGIKTSQEDQ